MPSPYLQIPLCLILLSSCPFSRWHQGCRHQEIEVTTRPHCWLSIIGMTCQDRLPTQATWHEFPPGVLSLVCLPCRLPLPPPSPRAPSLTRLSSPLAPLSQPLGSPPLRAFSTSNHGFPSLIHQPIFMQMMEWDWWYIFSNMSLMLFVCVWNFHYGICTQIE